MGLKFLNASGSGTLADAINAIEFCDSGEGGLQRGRRECPRALEQLGRRWILTGAARRDHSSEPERHAVCGGGRQQRDEQRRHADLPGQLCGAERRRGGGHQQPGRARRLLELRRDLGPSRRARRPGAVNAPERDLRLFQRHLDGHPSRVGRRRAAPLALHRQYRRRQVHAAEQCRSGIPGAVGHDDHRWSPQRRPRDRCVRPCREHVAGGDADRPTRRHDLRRPRVSPSARRRSTRMVPSAGWRSTPAPR